MTTEARNLRAMSISLLGLCLAGAPVTALGQVLVYDDPADFMDATGAAEAAIPDVATWGQATGSCGGSGAPSGLNSNPNVSVVIAFGDGNELTLKQDGPSQNAATGLCVFDTGHVRAPGNMTPSTMIANTVVANGGDDYEIVFDSPVHAVGFRLITNFSADEIVDLEDAGGFLISTEDIDGLTAPNTRQFVGFKSLTPIKAVYLDTLDGHVQNEGIDVIKIAEDYRVGIDIKPGSFPNSINLCSGGNVPVAILGSAELDVTTIDLSTVFFAGAGARMVGKPSDPKVQCAVEDVSGDFSLSDDGAPDGWDDLVCHIPTMDLGALSGEASGEVTAATDGGASLAGSDSVNIVRDGCL